MATTVAQDTATEPGLPTLHHLNNSQSQRILWLLEELAIAYPDFQYDLKLYTRDPKQHRAPPSLLEVDSLGRCPILTTPERRTITESTAIATYLLRTYDTSYIFSSTNPDWIRDEQLLSFASSSLGVLTGLELMFDIAAKHTPWPLVYISRKIKSSFDGFFATPEFKKNLSWLEKMLGDRDWFGEEKLGISDFVLSWPLDMTAVRQWVNLEKEYPKLHAWRQRCMAREGWKRGLEKGNGYDLTSW